MSQRPAATRRVADEYGARGRGARRGEGGAEDAGAVGFVVAVAAEGEISVEPRARQLEVRAALDVARDEAEARAAACEFGEEGGGARHRGARGVGEGGGQLFGDGVEYGLALGAGEGGSPVRGDFVEDAPVGVAREGDVREVVLHARRATQSAAERAPPGAVRVEQGAVDVEEDQDVAGCGHHGRKVYAKGRGRPSPVYGGRGSAREARQAERRVSRTGPGGIA